jgi:hypothetical protein
MAAFRCKESFVFWKDGSPVTVVSGDIVASVKDPRYVGHENAFEPIEEYATRRHQPVEETTAEPGTHRSVGKTTPPSK